MAFRKTIPYKSKAHISYNKETSATITVAHRVGHTTASVGAEEYSNKNSIRYRT